MFDMPSQKPTKKTIYDKRQNYKTSKTENNDI